MAQTKIDPQLRQPAAAPGPITEEGIEDHRHKKPKHKEGTQFPAFSHRPSGNGCSGVHKYHLEQEDGEHPHIVGIAAQEPAVRGKQAKRLAK